jgi:hypothetical protein
VVLSGFRSRSVDGEDSNVEQMTSYVQQQREVLDSGGATSRLYFFLSKRPFLTGNLDVCTRILDKHDQFFKGTKSRVETPLRPDSVRPGLRVERFLDHHNMGCSFGCVRRSRRPPFSRAAAILPDWIA